MEIVHLRLEACRVGPEDRVYAVVDELLHKPELHLTDLFVREDEPLVGSTVSGLVRFELEDAYGLDYVPDRIQIESFLDTVFDSGWKERIKQRALDEGRQTAAEDWCRFNAHSYDAGRLGLAIRRHPPQPMTLDDIGAPPELRTLAEEPRGLILFVGRTSAGKSTTQAAIVQHINARFSRHILRVEDPLEIPIVGDKSLITMRQVGVDVKSADLAVHDALRQRPDIICVSEVRDAATAHALFEAVDSGHLVLATVHGPNPVDSLARFLAYFGDAAPQRAQILSQVLLGVVGQVRLPRRDRRGYRAFFELLAGGEPDSDARNLIGAMNWSHLKARLNSGELANSTALSESLVEGVLSDEVYEEHALHAAFDPASFVQMLTRAGRGDTRPPVRANGNGLGATLR